MVVSRADLQKTLCAALGREAIRPGAEVTGFEQYKGGVVARFAGGREEHCELLIGTDGLHSTIRVQLLGDGPPLYAGYVAWHGVAELGEEPFPGGGAFEVWGRVERFGLVKLGRRRVSGTPRRTHRREQRTQERDVKRSCSHASEGGTRRSLWR